MSQQRHGQATIAAWRSQKGREAEAGRGGNRWPELADTREGSEVCPSDPGRLPKAQADSRKHHGSEKVLVVHRQEMWMISPHLVSELCQTRRESPMLRTGIIWEQDYTPPRGRGKPMTGTQP